MEKLHRLGERVGILGIPGAVLLDLVELGRGGGGHHVYIPVGGDGGLADHQERQVDVPAVQLFQSRGELDQGGAVLPKEQGGAAGKRLVDGAPFPGGLYRPGGRVYRLEEGAVGTAEHQVGLVPRLGQQGEGGAAGRLFQGCAGGESLLIGAQKHRHYNEKGEKSRQSHQGPGHPSPNFPFHTPHSPRSSKYDLA